MEREFKHDLQLIQITAFLQENIQFFIEYISTHSKKKSSHLVKLLQQESKQLEEQVDDKFV